MKRKVKDCIFIISILLNGLDFSWRHDRERKETKKHILGKHLSFSNFSNFWKLRHRYWYQLKKLFLINYQHVRS